MVAANDLTIFQLYLVRHWASAFENTSRNPLWPCWKFWTYTCSPLKCRAWACVSWTVFCYNCSSLTHHEISGFSKSNLDLRFHPISNWASDTPVVLWGVIRYKNKSFAILLLSSLDLASGSVPLVRQSHLRLGGTELTFGAWCHF